MKKTKTNKTEYVSPEVYGRIPYTFSSDIWSLGVILFFMSAGHLPFEGETIHALSLIVRLNEPKYPNDMPENIRSLIQWLLQKDPEKRPSLDQIKESSFLKPSSQKSGYTSMSARASPRRDERASPPLRLATTRSQPNLTSDLIVERLVATGRFSVQPKDGVRESPKASPNAEFLKIAPRPKKPVPASPLRDQYQSDDPKAKLVRIRKKKAASRDFQFKEERRRSVSISDVPDDSL